MERPGEPGKAGRMGGMFGGAAAGERCLMEQDAKNRTDGIRFEERKRWLFLGLPWTFTKYIVKEDMITVIEGFLSKRENDCYMYKVQDVELLESLAERIVGLGSVKCYTGDTTNPVLTITHVKNARTIKNYILEASEQARRRRRTMNMLDIGAEGEMPEEE